MDIFHDEEDEIPNPEFNSTENIQSSSFRVIAHIDLDCFYCQVERNLNPNLMGKPIAVVQYNPFGDLKSYAPEDDRTKNKGSIIAVSYEARAKGVKRIMRGNEAKSICPEIILIQVPTSNAKADLTIYREASSKILSVLGERYPSITIERASIDEVYLDITLESNRYLNNSTFESFLSESIKALKEAPTLIAGNDTKEIKMTKNDIRNGHSGQGDNIIEDLVSWFDRPALNWSLDDRLLLAGAMIVRQLRNDVLEKLGFTCSAGIATNKMLAKLSSGMHKPNKQTIVPSSAISALMSNLPYSRLQGFGGKLGSEIFQKFGERIVTMGDLLKIPRNNLVKAFGQETTKWIINRANGIDDDPVQNRSLPISIGCSKSFRNTKMLQPNQVSDGTVLFWFNELAKELHERMICDTNANQRKAKQLHVGFSVKFFERHNICDTSVSNQGSTNEWIESQGLSFSKVSRLPIQVDSLSISQLALSLMQKALIGNPRIQAALKDVDTHIWGITHLGLSVNQFESFSQGKNSILSFLQANQPNESDQSLHLFSQTNNEMESIPVINNLENNSDDHLCPSRPSLHSSSIIPNEESIESFSEIDLVSPASTITHLSTNNYPLHQTKRLTTDQGYNSRNKKRFKEKYLKNIDLDIFYSLPHEIQEEILQDQMLKYTSSSTNTPSIRSNFKDSSNASTTFSSSKITTWLSGK